MDEQDIAESVGIPNLKDDVATSLAQDVEYRIHEIVQEAMKFMRHGKRTKLTVDDINNALRVRNVEVQHLSYFAPWKGLNILAQVAQSTHSFHTHLLWVISHFMDSAQLTLHGSGGRLLDPAPPE